MQVLTAASLPRVTSLRPEVESPWRPSFLQLQAPRQRPGSMVYCNAQLQGSETRERPVDQQRPPTDDTQNDLPYMIESIKSSLRAARNSLGETTVSAYDTAWIALVRSLDGSDAPQFPVAIDWIARNQLPDGSWGDADMFIVQDRLINTLGCVVALATWGVHPDQCRRGLAYIQENLWRLGEDDEEWMMVGFEVTFPVLLEKAKSLGLDINYDDPALQDIYEKRNLKLAKIPREALHARPTTLLHSLEGMEDLDWERLLQFKCPAGSLHSSPAASAYALSATGDKELLEYLETALNNFDGGAPCTYPVDNFDRLWSVDRLRRLGISRYFTSEIEEYLEYAYRHLSPEGMSYGGLCPVKDIDDTAMGFRLFRLHGYDVSPSVFKHFEKDGEYVCFAGQSSQSLTAMYNSYRASQIAFPSDNDLDSLKAFCRAFLEHRRATGNLNDKWVIAKGLPSEVEYALDFPWKASLPRVETRVYLEQYGASEDAWIGKGLYRMTLVNNDLYLEAAKADFTNFQRLSRLEWLSLKRWYIRNNLQAHGVTEQSALRAYFLAAANIFEPDRAAERLGWARTAILAEAIASHFQRNSTGADGVMERLISGLESHDWDSQARESKDSAERSLLYALDELMGLHAFGNASDSLREAWKEWLMSWTKGSHGSCAGDTALLLVRTIEICSGRHGSNEQSQNNSEYARLEQITSSMCRKLGTKILAQNGGSMDDVEGIDQEVDLEMKELIQRVYGSRNNVNKVTRQTFLDVVKSFCYVAHCSPEIVNAHISKVLFENVN
uniref:ent-copalyl diphosphate synthase n=1 Tax=Leersia perrieri TaxID=77586 RepID=A0A0D9VHD3_9ORYZ